MNYCIILSKSIQLFTNYFLKILAFSKHFISTYTNTNSHSILHPHSLPNPISSIPDLDTWPDTLSPAHYIFKGLFTIEGGYNAASMFITKMPGIETLSKLITLSENLAHCRDLEGVRRNIPHYKWSGGIVGLYYTGDVE